MTSSFPYMMGGEESRQGLCSGKGMIRGTYRRDKENLCRK